MEIKALPRNRFGNVDVTGGLPPGSTHVPGQRLTVTCKAAGIECVPALVGWQKWRQRSKPDLDGVVIWSEDLERLQAAIARRDAGRRATVQRSLARHRRQERETAAFAAEISQEFPGMPEDDVWHCADRATEIGSGRVGRRRDQADRVQLALWAYIRHACTLYDEHLRAGLDRLDARDMVYEEIVAIFRAWSRRPASNLQQEHQAAAA